MNELEQLRGQIDEIDRQLVRLFEQRMHTVLRVAAYKRQAGLPVLHPGREQQVLDKCVSLLEDPSLAEDVTAWMQATMAVSRAAQERYLKENG